MNPREIIRVALRALARNKLRTVLTMLGIIIGVGAVICTVAIGQGAGQQVQEQIQALGENMFMIFAGSVTSRGVRTGSGGTNTLTAEDADAIMKEIPNIVAVSPGLNAAVQIVYGNQNWYTRAQGGSANFFEIRNWSLLRGSAFTEADVNSAANVCVIGTTVAQQLFGNEDPIGKVIRVQQLPFRVVGELVSKGQSGMGQDQDDTMIVPYTTVQKKLAGVSWVQNIFISVSSASAMPAAQSAITGLLRQRHHLRATEPDDFMIRSPNEFAQAASDASNTMTLLLASVATVSLIVGGIGIMNIMLVSVTERTREIGVRMAVGATEEDVQRQFLIEAVVLSSIGGLIGIACGIAGSAVVSHLLHWTTLVSPVAIFVAALFSAAVGIFFGYYPARKAARLDPIEALRYE